ncbi:TFIIB-type zinc ribbon-containing protein [Actinomadura parmotrematis]|uniref:Zf-TFIIB domain-containing protein n=1 Tax=Actinomadura parmotrematis TaxID=2864039 RepID=A0ABS7FPE5_9ACTN|nr:zf-TFIIB domain-containing protein [Actinomadura parmotrematis]MBW8482242.1 zf-TFIIB domain-containing protein [Actinomadura parmotrematis]
MHCPKCRGVMRTYTRNGVHIEQCDNCRGIFLDYGELEALSRMEAGYNAAPPPPPSSAPAWGAPAQVHHHHHPQHHRGHHGSMFHMLFST